MPTFPFLHVGALENPLLGLGSLGGRISMAFSAAAGRGVWAENAVDTLAAHFERAHNTLLLVEHRLEDEVNTTYGPDANPMKFLSRINKIQQELPLLEVECKRLLAAKQDFIEKTMSTLVENRNTLQRLQARAGLAISSEDTDLSFSSLQKILKEWNSHLD